MRTSTVNKHIELVEKWLANNDSVSQAELETNVADAKAAYAIYAAANAASNAAAYAAKWVAEYHKLVEEQGL